jgi:hypothetical protein
MSREFVRADALTPTLSHKERGKSSLSLEGEG